LTLTLVRAVKWHINKEFTSCKRTEGRENKGQIVYEVIKVPANHIAHSLLIRTVSQAPKQKNQKKLPGSSLWFSVNWIGFWGRPLNLITAQGVSGKLPLTWNQKPASPSKVAQVAEFYIILFITQPSEAHWKHRHLW